MPEITPAEAAQMAEQPVVEEGHPLAGAAFEAAAEAIGVGGRIDQERAVPAPPAREIEKVFTWLDHQTGAVLIAKNKDRNILIHHTDYGWMKMDSAGRKRWVKTQESAEVFDMSVIRTHISYGDPQVTIHMLKEPPQVPGCKLTDWFDGGFITLMQDAPNNLVMRAHMMRVLKIEPSLELDTFEKLREWVETAFPKPRNKTARALGPVVIRPPVQNTGGVPIQFRLVAIESGSATYSCRKVKRPEIQVTASMIREIIENGDSISIEQLMDQLKEYAWDDVENDWDYDEYDYGNEEPNDPDERDRTEITTSDARDLIINMLRAEDPELLEDLGIE